MKGPDHFSILDRPPRDPPAILLALATSASCENHPTARPPTQPRRTRKDHVASPNSKTVPTDCEPPQAARQPRSRSAETGVGTRHHSPVRRGRASDVPTRPLLLTGPVTRGHLSPAREHLCRS